MWYFRTIISFPSLLSFMFIIPRICRSPSLVSKLPGIYQVCLSGCWCHCARCRSKYCWCCHTCLIKTNSSSVYSSGRQPDLKKNNNFVIAAFNEYILRNSHYFWMSVNVHSCSAGIFSAACSHLQGAWLLFSLLLLWLLLDNEPLALSCCQSGRLAGLRPGHCCLMPSRSLSWEGKTGTCQWEDMG